jgi:hypothetical protein
VEDPHGQSATGRPPADAAVARDAADAAERLRGALARHGLLPGARAHRGVRGELSGDGRPLVALDPLSADVALAVADLLDRVRPGER